jgi:tetratricopeptide (TPR) repeat protein
MLDSAEQLERHASDLYQKRAYLQAAELFSTAAQRYQADMDASKAADMMNNRSVALLQAGDAVGALQAAAGTDKVFALEGDTRRQAMAFGNQAAALVELGKAKEALDLYQQASGLLKSEGETEMRSIILKRISSLNMRSGKALESLAAMDTALTIEKPANPKEKVLRRMLNFINRRT